MITIKLEFNFEEEELRDLFEEVDVKFTKKKAKELKKFFDENGVEGDMEYELIDHVQDFIKEHIENTFGE